MDTKIVRNIINIAMPIMMITLMAYQLIGKAYHEYAGTVLFIIFIIHNILNIKWYSNLFKGSYTPYRILSTIINILLLITMILLMISGIIMSEYTFSFLNINSGMAISRLIHLSASHTYGYAPWHIFTQKHKQHKKISFYTNIYLWCIFFVFQKNTILCFPH